MKFEIRTDLALENREIYRTAQKLESEIPGVETEFNDSDNDILITKVKIISDEGSNALGKPIGTYITIESQMLNDEIDRINQKIINTVSSTIKEVTKLKKNDTVLVVGLGNSDVTPDALGPKVIENLQITRHLLEYAPEYLADDTRSISAIIPGVLGTTGIETSEIVKGIVDRTKPSIVIVIDALASKNMDRISKTIQISDAGIIPGSGVGNSRFAITKETLDVPVIVIGIPTVVGVPTIVNDALEHILRKHENDISEEKIDKQTYMKEILENKKFDFMVTPKDIDDIIDNLSLLLADSINLALN